MFQMGGVGPMFGQVGFFHKFAGKDYEDKRPRDRYVAEAKRLLGVLDGRLAGRARMMGEYTIADMAVFPWVRNLVGFYGAGELVGIADFPHVTRALAAFVERPAVVRGVDIPKRGEACAPLRGDHGAVERPPALPGRGTERGRFRSFRTFAQGNPGRRPSRCRPEGPLPGPGPCGHYPFLIKGANRKRCQRKFHDAFELRRRRAFRAIHQATGRWRAIRQRK